MIQPFFWSPVAMVPIPSHSISFHRNALRRQGIGHDHPGNDRGFDPNGSEGPSWRWDLRDLRVRVSPLRSDIYESMANPESSETEHLLSQKGNSMGNSQSEILMNVVNPMLWTILNGLCEMGYAGYAMVCPHGWWMVNDPVMNPRSVALGPPQKEEVRQGEEGIGAQVSHKILERSSERWKTLKKSRSMRFFGISEKGN